MGAEEREDEINQPDDLEDDGGMLSEEEELEQEREFLTDIFRLSTTHVDVQGGGFYDIYTEGYFGQMHLDQLAPKFRVKLIESAPRGLHIAIQRKNKNRVKKQDANERKN